MLANSKFISLNKVLFNLAIILNYIIYVIFGTKDFFFIFFIIIILSFLVNLIIVFKSNRVLFFFFLLLLIMSLGSAVQVWDARSIFMFNAKRIFFEDTFSTYLKSFGFNINYPILYPVLSSTLNIYFNYWSEIIPKLSILFLSLIPLINIYSEIEKKDQLLFTFLFFLIFEYQILNGDCDVLIGLYSVNNIILINKIIKNTHSEKKANFLSIIDLLLANIIFLLLKPQSWAITFAFVNTLFILFIYKEIKLKKLLLVLLIILVSITPLYHWKLITLNNYNYIISSDYSFDMLKKIF